MEKRNKRILFVGGLEESVDRAVLHAAFIPFGDIADIDIPPDHTGAGSKHRGFGFGASSLSLLDFLCLLTRPCSQ